LVFDVSTGWQHYGPEGGYASFAGKDNTRGFLSGCFRNSNNHDLRGLTPEQMKDVDDWLDFYLKHETYRLVGRLKVDIDPNSPIPDDKCDK